MVDVKVNDWVLMDHPYSYDRFVVRKIVHITNHTVTVAHYRDLENIAKRKRNAIIGVFKDEAAALQAPALLEELSSKLMQDQKALQTVYNASAKALLNG